MGKSQSLYEHAKTVIPGGTQLLSKRPEMFLPNYWPAYYSKAKGCEVWDLDGNHYFDMSYMGIGANTLGYANDEVDNSAIEAIKNGGMCTLNAPEEVALADKLLELHKWASGVRYAKAGGEGMAQAVRIARAYTEKDVVLFCGYHGWHDWYLSANVTDSDALNDQHLSGLEPLGVPKGLAGTCRPFHYNNTKEFVNLFNLYKNQIAAIVMEPIRNDMPDPNFMKSIIEACHKNNVVLLFDEITAGFRLCPGGSHLVLGYEPDMAVFAKGMTNGYPLSAIIGKKEIMDVAQETFISSTFYTERVSLAAAYKTIDIYERERVWEKQSYYGQMVKNGWKSAADKHHVDIVVSGIDPLSHFNFVATNNLALKTFFIQEMLKRGFLASNAFYASYAHSDEVIERYICEVDVVFGEIEKLISKGIEIEKCLKGPVCHSGFERLN
jgi:glutamate-1-semialdehyde aminotransferase